MGDSLEEITESIKQKIKETERPEFKNFKGNPPLQNFYFLYEKILGKGRKERNPDFIRFDEEMALRLSFYIDYQLRRIHERNDDEMRVLLTVAQEADYREAIKSWGAAEKDYEEIWVYLEKKAEVKKKKGEGTYTGSHLPRRVGY